MNAAHYQEDECSALSLEMSGLSLTKLPLLIILWLKANHPLQHTHYSSFFDREASHTHH